MAKKTATTTEEQPLENGAENAVDKVSDKDSGKTGKNTPIVTEDEGYIDSEQMNSEAALAKMLGVPTEQVDQKQEAPPKESVLLGFDFPKPGEGENLNSEGPEAGDDDPMGGMDDSGLFEDNELVAQVGVELIDMVMTYAAMAIAKDFGNEKKYQLKDARKKRLEAPLAKILENREVKTSPELVFAFLVVAMYTPMMVSAVQTRRKKAEKEKAEPKGAVKSSRGVVTDAPKAPSVEPQPKAEIEEPDDAMGDFMAKMTPKAKPGRPAGSKDIKARKVYDDEARDKAIQEAKALRKDGWSFARIAKKFQISEGTATRWVRS